jgi:predicted metal-binding protein
MNRASKESMSTESIHRSSIAEAQSQPLVRAYPAPWKGQLILACRECQKKLKYEGKKSGLAKLRKMLKKRARKDEDGPRLHVVDVSCLKMCPKGGVTVCTQQQLEGNQCAILRTGADVDALLSDCKQAFARQEETRN